MARHLITVGSLSLLSLYDSLGMVILSLASAHHVQGVTPMIMCLDS